MAVYSNQLNQTQDLLSQVSFPQNLDGKIYFSFSQVQGKFLYPLKLLIWLHTKGEKLAFHYIRSVGIVETGELWRIDKAGKTILIAVLEIDDLS